MMAFLSAALGVSAVLARSQLIDEPLPCGTPICAALESHTLARAFGGSLALPALAATLAAGLFALAAARGSDRAWRWLGVLLGGVAAIALGLQVQTLLAYRGACPFCAAWTAAWLFAFGTWVAGRKPASMRGWPVATALGLGLACLLVVRISVPAIDLAAAARLGRAAADPHWSKVLEAKNGEPVDVVLADLACNSCRRVLARRLGESRPWSIRFVEPDVPYAAARLVLDAPSPPARRRALATLVADEGQTPERVAEFRGNLGVSSNLETDRRFRADADYCRALGVQGTPVVVRWDAARPRLIRP